MTSIPAAHPAAAPATSGATHQPYVPASQAPAELTLRAIVLGVLLGLIFGASNVYLALKIGLTVSASIPIAVLSITIFRWLGRSTILENNIVQTTGSAADSVSAGVVFTIPAILLMGYDLDISRVTILAIAGGLMGVLMMIPLRRALIVKEHGNLPYPEGTACAEVLIAGERGGIHAKTVFQAFGIAFLYKFLMTALKVWQEYPGRVIRSFQGAEVRVEASPELIGVGYIIGPRIAGYLFAGGCLAYVVLMPAIKLFGSAMTEPMFGTTKLIRDMSAGEIRSAFVFYIGAGAVASAGIIALARSLPTIVGAFRAGFADMRASRLGQAVAAKLRTDDDLPISLTVFGSIVLAIVIALLPQIGVNLLGGFLIIIFGFFFTTVSSRICGQVGSSANPISGMTIAALIAISFIFLLLGWNHIDDRVRAISIACVIAVAVANGGNTSQDLKTGFLVGATPRRQQIAILVVAIAAARAVGCMLTLLNGSFRYAVTEADASLRAHAALMALITDGILTHRLPWAPVLIGVFLSIALELAGIQALPVAVGVYLPITTSAGMFAGGVVRWLLEQRVKSENRSLAEIESGPGVLFASGMIAGGAIAGIVVAAIAGAGSARGRAADWLAESVGWYHHLGAFATSNTPALVLFGLFGAVLLRTGLRKQ